MKKCLRCRKPFTKAQPIHSLNSDSVIQGVEHFRHGTVYPNGHYHTKCCPQCRKSPLYVGDKVRFSEERQAYTVIAASFRYAVCTKPFNAKRTVLYTIVDFQRGVRGTENLIFSMGFEGRRKCEEALQRLVAGESEVSYRNVIKLQIDKINPLGSGYTSQATLDKITKLLATQHAAAVKLLRKAE